MHSNGFENLRHKPRNSNLLFEEVELVETPQKLNLELEKIIPEISFEHFTVFAKILFLIM